MKVYRYQALIEVSILCDARTPEEAQRIADERLAEIVDDLGEGGRNDSIVCATHLEMTPEDAVRLGNYPKLCKEDQYGDLEEVKT